MCHHVVTGSPCPQAVTSIDLKEESVMTVFELSILLSEELPWSIFSNRLKVPPK
jgi:hypothetical protein